MTRVRLFAAHAGLLLMLLTLDASHAKRSASSGIPVQFRGEWNLWLEDCGTRNNDTLLVIGRTSLEFYAALVRPKSVRLKHRTLTIRGQFQEGEDSSFGTVSMTISPDGRKLTIGDVHRFRCR